jgi:hypothetical protein
MIECNPNHFRITAHRLEDVGLDRRIVGARHCIFRARRNDHGSDRAQIGALS